VQAGEARSSTATNWLRRLWRLLCAATVALVALAFVGAAVSWHFSSAVLVPDHSGWPEDVTVERLSTDRVVLSRSEDTERPGIYGLLWQGGHALIGAVIAQDEETVTRSLRSVRGYLVLGMKVAIDPEVYSGNPKEALGLPLTDVRIPGELGPMPAWLIPGKSDAWAIVVHGSTAIPKRACE
jgi:uncharacterized protein